MRLMVFNNWNSGRMEAPQSFWMRVAMGLALNEKDKEKNQKDLQTQDELKSLNDFHLNASLLALQ